MAVTGGSVTGGAKYRRQCSFQRSSRRSLRRLLAVIVVIVPCVTLASTSAAQAQMSTPSPTPAPVRSDGSVVPGVPGLSAQIVTQPSDQATGVAPLAPVRVSVKNGTLDTVSLVDRDGRSVPGQLSSDKTSWTATAPLGYAQVYTWAGSATGIDRQARAITGSFETVRPERLISGRLNVGDQSTYGVAMPIALTFSSRVVDKAAVQKALSVHTSVPTEGSWAWLSDTTVHWRPKTYFAPNTQVNVIAKLYGIAMGDGGYGRADITSAFTIGRSYVLRGDTRTHRLLAYANGVRVADYPASYGLDSDPGRMTHSGTHVVMSKYPVYYMSNPKYHYKNVEAKWAVRISNNGEFVHSAPWSVRQQGRTNVSHGCINLSPANAAAVFNSALPGDPVEIVGTPRQLGPADGDYYDWTIPWSEWTARSALAPSA